MPAVANLIAIVRSNFQESCFWLPILNNPGYLHFQFLNLLSPLYFLFVDNSDTNFVSWNVVSTSFILLIRSKWAFILATAKLIYGGFVFLAQSIRYWYFLDSLSMLLPKCHRGLQFIWTSEKPLLLVYEFPLHLSCFVHPAQSMLVLIVLFLHKLFKFLAEFSFFLFHRVPLIHKYIIHFLILHPLLSLFSEPQLSNAFWIQKLVVFWSVKIAFE